MTTEIDNIRAMLAAHPRPADLAERRQRMNGFGARYPLPGDVRTEQVEIGGVAAEWTSTPAADPNRALLFFHGGGYVSGSIASHRHMVAQAGREAGTRTLALDYRLAPEHAFPDAVDDAVAAYRYLLSQGFAPGRIAVSGESAGGGLVIAMLLRLRELGEALPACCWCSSPWADLEMTGRSMTTKAKVDPLIQKSYLEELARSYLGGADARSPLASPIHADLHGLPPLLIQVGTAETLLDDAIRLAEAAGEADVQTTLRLWPGMIHAWHLFYPELREGRLSLAEVGGFVRRHMVSE